MRVSTLCPNCASTFSVSRAIVGKKAKCPRCEQPFTISTHESSSASNIFALPTAPAPSSPQSFISQPPVTRNRAGDEEYNNKYTPPKAATNWLQIIVPAAVTLSLGYGLGLLHHRVENRSAVAHHDLGNVNPEPRTKPHSVADNFASPTSAPPAVNQEFSASSLNEQQLASAKEAIAALSKIEAAIEIGVNYQKYTSLLADLNAVINEAERSLPESVLSSELNSTMQAYKDVAELWSFKIQYQNIGSEISKEFHSEIIERYADSLPKKDKIDTDLAMQMIWHGASTKIERARILLR